MLGNLVPRMWRCNNSCTETASNALMYIVVILLGYICWCNNKCRSVPETGYIKDSLSLGLVAFAVGTAAGVLVW